MSQKEWTWEWTWVGSISWVNWISGRSCWRALRAWARWHPFCWPWWSRFFGGLLGFLYSWLGVAAGGTLMFLFWRRVVKRFFWRVASRSARLQRAQQWVNRFDTASLFMLAILPFTPTAFMHLAFGISDMSTKHYLCTVLLGKGVMVAMMAVFGQSLVSSLKNPVYLLLAIVLWGGMYWVSKWFCKKHDLH